MALILITAGLLPAQNFDASDNGRLGGYYYMRLIAFSDVKSTGAIGRARSLYGMITFNGAGGYVVEGQLADNSTSPVTIARYVATGTYSVSTSGMAEMQNPLDRTQTIRAAAGDLAVVGSSTEGDIHDLFIAVPAGQDQVSNDVLAGSWRAGYIDFPQGKSTLAHTAFFGMTADGQGAVGDITVNGNGLDVGTVSYRIAGGSYSVSQKGTGSIVFPAPDSSSQPQVLGGEKLMYVSADGKVLLGGSAAGFDMLVAVRDFPDATDATYQGTYYIAGASIDPTQLAQGVNHFFFYTGSAAADGQYATWWHQRINPAGTPSYDLTTVGGFHVGQDGIMEAPTQRLALCSDGDAFIETGNGSDYHFVFGVRVRPAADDGVWLNPVGIVNAANYAPVTNPVAPGEVVSLGGSGLAGSTLAAAGPPLPASLGGVQVKVNGRAAPLMYVSPNQILAVVPYATAGKFATFQVIRDEQVSNAVTTYANVMSPGVFTLTTGGTGPAAVLHDDLTPVSADNPARPGETVTLYLTGMGPVSPAIADGAPASLQPPIHTVYEKDLQVFIGGRPAPVSFAGLAPGFAGIYQVKCRVPEGAGPGDVYIGIDAVPAQFTSMSTIRIQE